MVTSIEAVVWA